MLLCFIVFFACSSSDFLYLALNCYCFQAPGCGKSKENKSVQGANRANSPWQKPTTSWCCFSGHVWSLLALRKIGLLGMMCFFKGTSGRKIQDNILQQSWKQCKRTPIFWNMSSSQKRGLWQQYPQWGRGGFCGVGWNPEHPNLRFL